MASLKESLTSSVGRKYVMGLTGLFLIVFLLVHLSGNFTLLLKDGTAFNTYAHFMKENLLIKLSEVILFGGFLLHIIQGLMLTAKNKAARAVNYQVAHKHDKVDWTSKAMSALGMILLIFLIIHLYDFFRFKYFVADPQMTADGTMIDLHGIVRHEFSEGGLEGIFHLAVYTLGMAAVSFHLWHGFQSTFQSLGLRHPKYTPFIQGLGKLYAVVVPAAFVAIPYIIKFTAEAH